MKKNDKPSGIVIFAIVVGLLIFVTHCEDLNRIPGVHVESNGMSVDIGDFHYHS